MKTLELYAGIGGVAAAGADVVAAIDHDEFAHAAYIANFDHPAHRINLVSIRTERLRSFAADAWWLSPPCQPFTVRGAGRDVEDRRCESLLALLPKIAELRPAVVLLENVPGFEGSEAHRRVREAFAYGHVSEASICPTALGVPMRRRRFYLAVTPHPVDLRPDLHPLRPLADALDAEPLPGTELDAAFLERFGDALHVVDATDPLAEAACFTGAYGRSPVYAGSYLRRDGVLRLFSHSEIARLMGLPGSYRFPNPDRATKLLGNSLSVDVVRHLLARTGVL